MHPLAMYFADIYSTVHLVSNQMAIQHFFIVNYLVANNNDGKMHNALILFAVKLICDGQY